MLSMQAHLLRLIDKKELSLATTQPQQPQSLAVVQVCRGLAGA